MKRKPNEKRNQPKAKRSQTKPNKNESEATKNTNLQNVTMYTRLKTKRAKSPLPNKLQVFERHVVAMKLATLLS